MFVRGFKTWCENTSLQIRKELGLSRTDPLKASEFATYLGVRLATPHDIPGLSPQVNDVLLGSEVASWSAVTISANGVDLIIYNPHHSPGRQSSDLMHELSHLLMGHEANRLFFVSDQIALRSYDKAHEDEADWLAGCLLLPREALLSIVRMRISAQRACKLYGVSERLLNYRIDITGVRYQAGGAKRVKKT